MRSTVATILAIAASYSSTVGAQLPPANRLSSDFNSTFRLTQDQIDLAKITAIQARSIENVMNFDRSQLAFGGPHEDEFYTLPPLTKNLKSLEPGKLLKVQAFTDPTSYSISPNTALSRILYTTTNINGTVIPASAFVLWPYTARHIKNVSNDEVAPVVLWNHGTSGHFAEAAPSAHRSLWYGYEAPFTLALNGYAVVAPDYAGLGVSKSWDGSHIPHQYNLQAAGAGDALYSLRAAREAFPGKLSKEFVSMGHSQGGGVAWAIPEILEKYPEKFVDLLPGYRGTVAGSPVTTTFATDSVNLLLTWIGMVLDGIFPNFKLEYWLTPLGIARTQLNQAIEGGIAVAMQLFASGEDVIREDWNSTWYAQAYSDLASAGRKRFTGPILVIQGTNDAYVPYEADSATVNATCKEFPENDLEFLVVPGAGHVPSLDASQSIWLKWIEDRFEGNPVQKGCVRRELKSFLPREQYLSTGTSFLQWAGKPEWSYQTILGI